MQLKLTKPLPLSQLHLLVNKVYPGENLPQGTGIIHGTGETEWTIQLSILITSPCKWRPIRGLLRNTKLIFIEVGSNLHKQVDIDSTNLVMTDVVWLWVTQP